MIALTSRRSVFWLAAATLVCFAGCQNGGAKAPNSSLGTLIRPSSVGASLSKKVTSEQKADVKIAVARSLEMKGQTDQAIQAYLDAIRSDDTRSDAYHRLAVLHDKKGDCEASQEFYQAALKRDPDNAELICDIGYSCYLQGRWKDAEQNLHRALTLQPKLARAHNNLGLLLARTDRHEQALEEFARAGCSSAESRANLAFALMLEKRWSDAQRLFAMALAADPELEAARDGLDTLHALNRKPQQGRTAEGANHPRHGVTPAAFHSLGPSQKPMLLPRLRPEKVAASRQPQ
jgi:Flp pilus assembly protein TadD